MELSRLPRFLSCFCFRRFVDSATHDIHPLLLARHFRTVRRLAGRYASGRNRCSAAFVGLTVQSYNPNRLLCENRDPLVLQQVRRPVRVDQMARPRGWLRHRARRGSQRSHLLLARSKAAFRYPARESEVRNRQLSTV